MIRQWTIKETLVLSIGNYLDGGRAVLHNFEGPSLVLFDSGYRGVDLYEKKSLQCITS